MVRMTIIGLFVDAISLIISAFCGMKVWNWFVPEIFESAPRLSFIMSLGLGLTISIFFIQGQHKMEDFDDQNIVNSFMNAVFTQIMNGATKPIMLLVYAWIVHMSF